MNEKFHELNRGMAVQVVAQKIAEGQIDPLETSFEGLVDQFQKAVVSVAEGFGVKATSAAPKPKRTPRKDAPKAMGGGKRSGIDPEHLKSYVGSSKEGAASLQQIADNFKVSKGVAKRAVEALPGVQSVTGAPSAGKRGVPPIVYWVE